MSPYSCGGVDKVDKYGINSKSELHHKRKLKKNPYLFRTLGLR